MLIAFVHTDKAFMPETTAYARFFSKHNIGCVVCSPDELNGLKRDVDWYFLGTDRSKQQPGVIRIHEYTSASVPPSGYWKDWYKRFVNVKPDYRLFLNNYVKQRLHFGPDTPFGFRDMGIPESWLKESATATKEYDFIYIGDTAPQRKPELFLAPFAGGSLRDRRILVVTRNYERLRQAYQHWPNIVFSGPLDHESIRRHILSARFGLNYIPDQPPFNRQTSTKLLEYAACKIPVISTRYHWVEEFHAQYGGNFFYVQQDLADLRWDAINNYKYQFPDLSDWTWDQQIRKSGVLEFLQSRIPGLMF